MTVGPATIQALTELIRYGSVRCRVALSTVARWGIGGPADVLLTPGSAVELAGALRLLDEAAVRHVVIGDGSNLLFDDAGFRGVVIRIGRLLGGVSIGGEGEVIAGAGAWVPSVVRAIISAGLSGAQHAIGIPGTLGGLVVMNGGSQRRGIGEHVISVRALDRQGGMHRLDHAALDFAYRRSSLQDNELILVECTLRFGRGDATALRREAIDILAARRNKFPRVRANCGSVFVSDPKLYEMIGPPGMLIERVGLKGRVLGDAQISPRHANFIVNNGRARAQDVLGLIGLAREKVLAATGLAMEAEVRHLDQLGRLRPAHDVATAFVDKEFDRHG